MKYVDLTHKISSNMPVFSGDPEVKIKQETSLQEDGVVLESFCSGTHAGTHIDAPGHFIDQGKRISDMPINSFFGLAHCVDVRNNSIIGIDQVNKLDFTIKKAVIFCTGWGNFFYEDKYFQNHPVISKECATFLVDNGVTMIGIDSPSVDKYPYDIHKILLVNNVIIIENLTNVEQILGAANIEIIALPLNISAYGSPARVIAKLI